MSISRLWCFACLCLIAWPSVAQHSAEHHHDHMMTIDRDGMVMNSNSEILPQDCSAVSVELKIEVRVGRAYARQGFTYGFNQHEWRVQPCARLTVTLVNEDEVRHQWMVHGLPRYLYPQGMFHLEASGGKSKTGTFILPSDKETYLAHCDISQHMEKGLKGQVIVGDGNGVLPSIPGISGARFPDEY
jgi:plastocyanin